MKACWYTSFIVEKDRFFLLENILRTIRKKISFKSCSGFENSKTFFLHCEKRLLEPLFFKSVMYLGSVMLNNIFELNEAGSFGCYFFFQYTASFQYL